MKSEFEKAYALGSLVKSNNFQTDRGMYRIDLYLWNDNVYFFKYRDGKLLECCNLNKRGIREEFNA
jgi:hypothetical protein